MVFPEVDLSVCVMLSGGYLSNLTFDACLYDQAVDLGPV